MNRRRLRIRFAVSALLVMLGTILPSDANNIKVDNVRTRDLDTGSKTVEIEFDLSWENSWRDAENHDAAWVFAKFRAPGSNAWEHAYLVPDAGMHAAPAAVIAVGTNDAGGLGAGLGMGVFVYADANRVQSPVHYPGVRLRWNFGASGYEFTSGTQVDVSVHAIEMVFVPEGPFHVGSGGTERGSFTDGSWLSGPTIPFTISSEDALEIGPEAGKLWGTNPAHGEQGVGEAGTLSAAFPKGYRAFYCMKYPLTQGQYVNFLNLLTAAQASNRAWTGGGDRHMIFETDGVYATSAPDRAINRFLWVDGSAYADWSGLRAMTELEYEKAARGPEYPVPNEYAWGGGDGGIARITGTFAFSGEEGSGADTVVRNETQLGQGAMIYQNFRPNPIGPVRVGIFAEPGATRAQAGASYWGIMDLSGNTTERTVSVHSASGARTRTGIHGNGMLAVNGDTTLTTEWDGYTGAGLRGGHYSTVHESARVSDRVFARYARQTRDHGTDAGPGGWRGVRTAPY